MNILKSSITFFGVSALVIGCASTQPSGQLVQARQVVRSAEMGQTSQNAPKDLYEAQQLLAKAEAAHKDDARSSTELHYSYLAHRKALTAMAHSRAEESKGMQKDNKEAYTATLESKAAQLKQQNNTKNLELVRSEGQLEQSKLTADLQGRELAAANKAAIDKQQELDAEKAARVQAEEKSRLALQSLQAMAAVKTDNDRLLITFAGGVLFETNKTVLLSSAKERMRPLAEALRNYRSSDPIIIEGHTDDRGPDMHNQQLSQARAESVRAFLIEGGVPPEVLVAVGKGEGQPVAANSNAEGRANNRRVEIIVPDRHKLSMQ